MSGERRIPSAAQDLDALLALALSRPHDALAAARSLLSGPVEAGVAAVAHQAAGIVLRDFGDIDEALTEFRVAMACARRAGDAERHADVRAAFGVALVMAGRSRAGLAEIERAAQGASGAAAGRIQIRKAHSLWVLGRNAEMLRAAQRAVTLLEGSGDPVWQARALNHRAMANLALGAVARADADYARCEQLFARAGQALEFASVRHDRGATAFARGDLPTAIALLDDAQHVVDELGVFEPELHVTRVQVLLAAELSRDALRVADQAVARSVRQHGSATRRGELLFAAARAASAAGDPATAAVRSAEALRMFRRQQRDRWAARAELVLLESRFDAGDPSPGLLRAATRLAPSLEELDAARAPEAHLLAGRIALARGRRVAGARHLRAAAARRPRDLRARTTRMAGARRARRGRGTAPRHAGRLRAGARPRRRPSRDARRHRAAGPGHGTGRGAGRAGAAACHRHRERPATAHLERALARHGADRPAGPPAGRPGDDPRPRGAAHAGPPPGEHR